jgi:energy-coupling factor transporter ATP-binding protein EcfA2
MMCVRDSLYAGLKNYLFLHSGAVARDNRAVLLTGPSGAGKSTLTTALLNYGYKYVTDEVVVISTADLGVLPFQRPIYLYGWLPVLSSENSKEYEAFCFKEKYGKNMEYWQFIVPKNNAVLAKESSLDLGFIIFPRFNKEQKHASLRHISKAEAAFHLMQNGWNMPHFKDYSLKVCSELVRRADCYWLEMGDLKEACELIGKIADNGSDSVDPELLNNVWRNREFS